MTPLTLGALISAGCIALLGVMFWIAAKAPLGWEDEETGFHLGEEPLDDPENWGGR